MNKKRLLGIILSIILVLGLTPMVCMTARAAWSGEGDGSASAPYKIGTKAELEKFRDIINGTNGEVQNNDACAVLTADIDLEDAGWTPIGSEEHKYTGSFDGGGHTLSGLNSSGINVGLFGFLGNGGTVKNLTINGSVTIPDTDYQTNGYAGGVAAISEGGTVESVSVNAAIIVSDTSYQGSSAIIGGIVGKNEYGMICNCSNSGAVTVNKTAYMGSAFVGGIVGDNKNGTIFDCNNTGNVSANTDGGWASAFAGGIVGESEDGTIYHCNSTGDVSVNATSANSDAFSGGIVGKSGGGTIYHCNNTGKVSANATSANSNAFSGGIVGKSGGGTVQNCNNTGDVTAAIDNAYVSAYAGGITGKSGDAVFNCSSTGNVTASAPDVAHTTVYAGGIVGHNDNSGTIRYVSNAGTISANGGDAAGTHAHAGGIAGHSDGTVQYACSAGNASATASGTSSSCSAGGVVGYNIGSVTYYYYSGTGNAVDGGTEGSEPYASLDAVVAASHLAWAKDNSGNLVLLGMDDNAPRTPATWNDLHDALALGGYIKLTATVTYGTGGGTYESSELIVPSGVTVTLDLAGHTIDRHVGNTAVLSGYVIYVTGNLTLNDSGTGGGTLTGGNTSGNGGGVLVNGTFTMNGGTITGNSAKFYGGGVCLSTGTFTMNGGTITGNITAQSGGGVHINNYCTFQASGSATVTGNKRIAETVETVNNIYLSNNSNINVTGALAGSIGVTMNTPGVFTSGLPGKGTAENFTSDDATYAVGLTEACEAALGYTVTLTAGAGMTKTSGDGAQFILPGSSMGDVVYAANDGYCFQTDYASLVTTNGITVARVSDTQITVSGTPTANTTLALAGATAKSKSSPTPVTPSASVKTAPVANTLTYDGQAKELVTAGEAKGGTMQYAIGKSKTSMPTSGWSESIPTSTDAGTYFVWYKAKGDSSHTNSVPKCVTVTIEKAPSTVTIEPTVEIKTLISSGEPQELITAGEAAGGTMQYAVGTSESTAPDDGWSAEIPTGTDPGTYYIWYKVVGDNNHEDLETSYAGATTIIENHSDKVLAIDEEKGIATVKDDVSGGTTEVPLYVITEGLIYRMYDPNRGEHFYTKDPEEAELLVQLGWIHESDSDFTVVSTTEEAAIPVYRLYNPNFGGMHFYTTDADDAKYLMSLGWNYEGISHYVYSASSTKGTPQHRLYNPNSPSGEHNWTSDESEVDMLIAAGWIYEGIDWRVE